MDFSGFFDFSGFSHFIDCNNPPCGVVTPAIDAIMAESPTIDYDDFADRSPESKVDSNHDPNKKIRLAWRHAGAMLAGARAAAGGDAGVAS